MTINIKECVTNYNAVSYGNLRCYYSGFIYKSGSRAGEASIKKLLNEYESAQNLNLKDFYGSYRVIIEDLLKKNIIFFGDNAGNCCFYYDEVSGTFSDSFLKVVGHLEDLSPNYDAITEFISFNCIYSEETICKGVLRTSPSKYYIIEQNKIKEKEKELIELEECHKYANLNKFMNDFVYASAEIEKALVITGGTDSRTVLSHMISQNADFHLFISGREELEDVKIAREVSAKLGKSLHVSYEKIENIDEVELKRLFIRTDGVYGFVSRLRLHKKHDMLEELGVKLEIGGVSGELYKNSFLNQDFPFYNRGNINKEKFYNMKVNPENFNEVFFTDNIKNSKKTMKERVLKNIFGKISDKKHSVYFKAGIKALQYRMTTITNSSSFTIPITSPLSEIDVMALPYKEKPWKLELNQWQRGEVSKYCSQIASIKTDRGTTLKDGKLSIMKELVGTYIYLFKIGLSRALGIKRADHISKRVDGFNVIREKAFFYKAMNKCKELNILHKDVQVESIPDVLADRLLTIAMVFGVDDLFVDM